MAGSLNKVTLIGNLGKDPEIRYSKDNQPIANLTIATSEKWKDQSGQYQERTEWHRVVVFGNLADVVSKYLKKGSTVYFEGKLQTRKWQDKDGQDRYTTEVVVDRGGQMVMLGKASSQTSEEGQATDTNNNGFDDEVPF